MFIQSRTARRTSARSLGYWPCSYHLTRSSLSPRMLKNFAALFHQPYARALALAELPLSRAFVGVPMAGSLYLSSVALIYLHHKRWAIRAGVWRAHCVLVHKPPLLAIR